MRLPLSVIILGFTIPSLGQFKVNHYIDSLGPAPTYTLTQTCTCIDEIDCDAIAGCVEINTEPGVFHMGSDSIRQRTAVWNTTQHDWDNDFEEYYRVFFGCDDATGADGLSFSIQDFGTDYIGGGGGNLGYHPGPPTYNTPNNMLSIEFDTYDNGGLDIADDHIGLFDGNKNNLHAGASIVSIGDVENNLSHLVKITYDASTTTLTVYIDGTSVYSVSVDIGTYFTATSGEAWWGWTSSTGTAKNEQWVSSDGTSSPPDYTPGCSCSEGPIPSISKDDELCMNTVTLNAQVTAHADIIFNWYKNDTLLISTASPTITTTDSATYNVVVDSASASCFYEDFLDLPVNCVLPVEYLNIDVTVNAEDDAILQWTTLSETNNDYFQIERSYNLVDFEVIGSLPGMGNSHFQHKYAYIDQPRKSCTYRLKQVDFNGDFTYSNLIALNKKTDSFTSVYWDAENNSIVVDGDFDELEPTHFSIRNLNGHAQVCGKPSINANGSLTIPADNLTNGVYLITIQQLNKKTLERHKFIKFGH